MSTGKRPSSVGQKVRIGLSITGLIVLGLLILLFTIDLGRFKPLILDFASDYLERRIDIDGPLTIEIGRKVRVAGQDVRVASEEWTEVPQLVSVERFTIVMDTWSLLTGIALFDDVQVNGIRANLAVDEEGNDNWTFAGLEEEETTPVVIRRATIADARISYTTPDLPPILLVTSRLDLKEEPDSGLDFELAGAFNEATLRATGNLGTVDSLIDGRDVRFQVTGAVGEISIAGSGQIDDLYEPRRPEFEMSLQGPNAEYLTDILGMDPVTTGKFVFHANADETADALMLSVEGSYGDFDLDLTSQVADLQTLDDLQLTAHAEGPSIGTVARLAGQTDFPEAPFSIDAQVKMSGQALEVERFLFDLGAATLEASASLPSFPGLDGAQANLVAAGPQFGDFNRLLGLPGALTGPFEAKLSLDRTASGSVLEARLDANALQASAAGTLTDDPELIGSKVSVQLGGDDAALVTTAFGAEGVPAEPFAASADLTVGETAIDIENGVASLAQVDVKVSGSVGRDPLSQATRLRLETKMADLEQTLATFGFAAQGIPKGALTLAGEIGRGDDEYLIDPLVARLGDIDARVTAKIGDSLALPDITAQFEVTGSNLPQLAQLEDAYLSNEPFRVTGRLAFSDEDTIRVEDLAVAYGPAGARAALSLSLSDPVAAGEMRIEAEGTDLTALVPVAADYVAAEAAFSILGGGRWRDGSLWLEDATIRVGESSLDLKGELHAPPEIAGTELELRASLPSLKILEVVAEQTLPDEPLTLLAGVRAEADTLRLTAFDLALGQSELSGTAAYRPAREPDDVSGLTAELSSRLLDLRPLQAAFATESVEQPAEPKSDRVIPDEQLPLDQLRLVNGEVLLTVERMQLDNANLTEVLLDANLTDGALRIERFELGGEAGGKLGGALRLVPSADGAELGFEMDGTNLIVGLPAATEEARQLLPRYELSTRLTASGATAQALASTSRGYLRLVADEGRIALGAVGFLMRDFAGAVFDSINPLAKQETDSKVQCLAVLVEVNDGVVVGKPALVLQTDQLNIVGEARIDLSSEELNAKFNTQARKGIGIGISDLVSPLTEVGGTLGSPRLQLDTAGTIVEGGAAVATFGISFLVKKAANRWFADKNPCRTAIADADKDLAEGGVPLSEPNR